MAPPTTVIIFSFLTHVVNNSSLSKLILISFHFNVLVGCPQLPGLVWWKAPERQGSQLISALSHALAWQKGPGFSHFYILIRKQQNESTGWCVNSIRKCSYNSQNIPTMPVYFPESAQAPPNSSFSSRGQAPESPALAFSPPYPSRSLRAPAWKKDARAPDIDKQMCYNVRGSESMTWVILFSGWMVYCLKVSVETQSQEVYPRPSLSSGSLKIRAVRTPMGASPVLMDTPSLVSELFPQGPQMASEVARMP